MRAPGLYAGKSGVDGFQRWERTAAGQAWRANWRAMPVHWRWGMGQ